MIPPLGALFANIFICELENNIIPALRDKVLHWKRYICLHQAKHRTRDPNRLELISREHQIHKPGITISITSPVSLNVLTGR